jgi:hypothetical protein
MIRFQAIGSRITDLGLRGRRDRNSRGILQTIDASGHSWLSKWAHPAVSHRALRLSFGQAKRFFTSTRLGAPSTTGSP